MADLKNNPALSSPSKDPCAWLFAYLHRRAHLSSFMSDFKCPPACTRPGCRNPDLQVQVSLVDLLGAALHLKEPAAAIFSRHYSLGLFAHERDGWIRMVALKLKKPCPFLENDRCGIYPVRPLPCALFPEYLVYQGKFAENAGKEHFRDYLCLHGPLPLSPERARVMGELGNMWERESLISSFSLFHHGSCHLDFSNLTGELLHAGKSSKDGESAERAGPGRFIPHQVLESFFLERMAHLPPFAGINEKIQHFHNPKGQAQLLRLLEDDRLLRKLKRDENDRTVVFRLVQGKLRARRRSLLPAEYKYY